MQTGTSGKCFAQFDIFAFLPTVVHMIKNVLTSDFTYASNNETLRVEINKSLPEVMSPIGNISSNLISGNSITHSEKSLI